MGEIRPYFVGAELEKVADTIDRVGCLGTIALEILAREDIGTDTLALSWAELDEGDRRTVDFELEKLCSFEEDIPTLDWAPRLPPEAYLAISHVVDQYHDALPYSDAERRWLVAAYDQVDRQFRSLGVSVDYRTSSNAVAQMTETLVTLGVHCTVSGAELIERWWNWRRGAEQFKDAGTFDSAMDAMRQMAELIPEPEALRERLYGHD